MGGKVVAFYGGGASDPAYGLKQHSYEERKDRLAENFEYCLALYLVLAEEGVYFEYNDGFRAEKHVWNVEYPEYSRPLGPPEGPARRDGDVFTREFDHAHVTLDLANRTADVEWR